MSTHIPNTFQTPNLFIDRAMVHLTDSEFRVLVFATRHIYGWQDKAVKNLAYISLKMFEDGFTTKDGQQYYGCGLSRGAIIKAVQGLVDCGMLAREGKPTDKGQAYKIGEVIDWNKLEQRTAKRRGDYQKKTVKATETRQGVTSDVPVTSHVTMLGNVPRYSPSNVARTESNPSSNPSSKGEEISKRKTPTKTPANHPLVEAWATTKGFKSLDIGAAIGGYKYLTAARRMARWNPPPTSDEMKTVMERSKSTDYDFTWLETDIPKLRLEKANTKPAAARPAPIIADTPPATPEERAALLAAMADIRPEWEKDKSA